MRRYVRWALFVGGLVGVGIATRAALGDARDQPLPGVPAMAAAFVLQLASVTFAAFSWVAVVDPPAGASRRGVLSAFASSQLTKYLPGGGVVQAAGQAEMSALAGVPRSRVVAALPLSVLAAVVAAGWFAVPLAFDAHLQTWARVVALCCIAGPVVLQPRIGSVVVTLAGRVLRRPVAADAAPPMTALRRSFLLALGNIGCTSAAYTVLLNDAGVSVAWPRGIGAFAAAWAIGFLVLPLPSGIGVREAALVAALPGIPSAALLTASIAHRLVSLPAEVVVAGGARYGRARAEGQRAGRDRT